MTERTFITEWVVELSEKGLKEFPADFLSTDDIKTVNIPNKTLVIGQEFFGNYEILSVDGQQVYHASNIDEAKYIIYSNRTKPLAVKIPNNPEYIKKTLYLYNEYIDSIIKQIESHYKKNFHESNNSNYVINEIFRHLNLIRL